MSHRPNAMEEDFRALATNSWLPQGLIAGSKAAVAPPPGEDTRMFHIKIHRSVRSQEAGQRGRLTSRPRLRGKPRRSLEESGTLAPCGFQDSSRPANRQAKISGLVASQYSIPASTGIEENDILPVAGWDACAQHGWSRGEAVLADNWRSWVFSTPREDGRVIATGSPSLVPRKPWEPWLSKGFARTTCCRRPVCPPGRAWPPSA